MCCKLNFCLVFKVFGRLKDVQVNIFVLKISISINLFCQLNYLLRNLLIIGLIVGVSVIFMVIYLIMFVDCFWLNRLCMIVCFKIRFVFLLNVWIILVLIRNLRVGVIRYNMVLIIKIVVFNNIIMWCLNWFDNGLNKI